MLVPDITIIQKTHSFLWILCHFRLILNRNGSNPKSNYRGQRQRIRWRPSHPLFPLISVAWSESKNTVGELDRGQTVEPQTFRIPGSRTNLGDARVTFWSRRTFGADNDGRITDEGCSKPGWRFRTSIPSAGPLRIDKRVSDTHIARSCFLHACLRIIPLDRSNFHGN